MICINLNSAQLDYIHQYLTAKTTVITSLPIKPNKLNKLFTRVASGMNRTKQPEPIQFEKKIRLVSVTRKVSSSKMAGKG